LYVGLLFLVLVPIVVLLATPAGILVKIWLTDRTDWRIEDYMCTLPDGCKESIEARKRAREQIRTSTKAELEEH
jgi:hypothetical protein